MGSVHAEITLKNATDEMKVREGFIKEEEVRSVTVQALVDTGAMSLVITEELCQKLGLRIMGKRPTRVANGQRESCKVTEPVEIRWKNRFSSLSALVLPGLKNVLLGVVPLRVGRFLHGHRSPRFHPSSSRAYATLVCRRSRSPCQNSTLSARST